MIRLRVAACALVLPLVVASSAKSQSPGERAAPSPTEQAGPPPSPPAVATRPIVFLPDRPVVELQFEGIGLVDGIWREGWIPVCIGPCAGPVPLAEKYRVAGPNVRNSRLFQIGPGNAPLRLEAKSGSLSGFSLGTGATITGGIALPVGLLWAGFADFCGLSNQPGACDSRAEQQAIGLLVAGLGAATLVTGIVLLVRNRTIVAGDEPPRPAAPAHD